MVRTLSALERELGVTLLRRTTRRMSLTEEGRIYLDRARRLLADLEEAEALVGSRRTSPRGQLRVTAPVLFGQMHVAPLLTAFLREYEEVGLDLVLLDRSVDLVDEGLDVAVRIGELPDSSLIATSAGRVGTVVCASPELARAHAPPHPDALATLPCVLFDGISPGQIWRFDDAGRELAVRVQGRLRTNQAQPAIDACIEGAGFGRFLSYQVAPALREGRLVRVLEAFEPRERPVQLAYPGARLVSSRLRAFLDWMKPRLSERLATA